MLDRFLSSLSGELSNISCSTSRTAEAGSWAKPQSRLQKTTNYQNILDIHENSETKWANFLREVTRRERMELDRNCLYMKQVINGTVAVIFMEEH